jgi:cell division protein DivIC
MRVVKIGEQLKNIWSKFAGNFYLATSILFVIWMLFFDSNDFFTQFTYWRRLHAAKNEKEYYQERIVEVTRDREELQNNPQLLEKFAREKYLMKRPEEDLFLVVEKE